MYIVSPGIHEEQYVNRHGSKSLNVQVVSITFLLLTFFLSKMCLIVSSYSSCLQVCDSDMIILNINARFPGSTQDSFIWTNSAVRAKMEEVYRGEEQCWLLGMCTSLKSYPCQQGNE